jgi:2-methylcitrate dehydratase PrpD
MVYGQRFPWSKMVLEHARENGLGGNVVLPGLPGERFHAGAAALVMGTMAHGFELDSLRKPGAGVHPGATVALPALAAAQATGASGKELITAIVAGCEVMFRIGAATLHTPEQIGFHAPGLTGPFGAATAAGILYGLTSEQLVNAYGICGSTGGGLLAFTQSGQGGMVKRLHLGRAAEAGILAVSLANRGFEGPSSVLDGRFGLLDSYCSQSDQTQLTRQLGIEYELENLCIKRYACHITAQAPIAALREKMLEEDFTGRDIAKLSVSCSDKVVSHHGNTNPTDIMLAQYSVPFSLAIAAFYDPISPSAFTPEVIESSSVRGLAEKVQLVSNGQQKGWAAHLTIQLKDGRKVDTDASTFPGCPELPLTENALWEKFSVLCESINKEQRGKLFSDLKTIEQLDQLHF